MGDAKTSSEPARNVIVSSNPEQLLQDKRSAPGGDTESADAAGVSQQLAQPQLSEDIASPFVQEPFPIHQNQQYPQQQFLQSPVPMIPQRQQPGNQSAPHGAFNMSNMQRALPIPVMSHPQQHPPPLPQRQQAQATRFQTGPSAAAVAYHISQQVQQQYQSTGTQDPTQFFNALNYQPTPALYDQYHQAYTMTPQDPSLHQVAFAAPYSSSYPPQFPQSTGYPQAGFGQQWYPQQQSNPYFLMQSAFVPHHIGAMQSTTQRLMAQQQPYHARRDLYRRPSAPTRQPTFPRRGSDSETIAHGDLPPGDFGHLWGFQQPAARGTPGQEYFLHPSKTRDQSRSNSSGATSGADTSATSVGTYAHEITPSRTGSSLPRGPPRKPRQSGNALWVGNLPPGTNVVDLKDYFSRDATSDIESVFLISKSNCAFVNYRTETACNEAMARFHDSRFQNTRLVCRLRRSSTPLAGSTPQPTVLSRSPVSVDGAATQVDGVDGRNEREVGSCSSVEETKSPPIGPAGPRALRRSAKDRYFIVKSLTIEDLELSVRNGVWATQNHNEAVLNKAFETAENVYLIFSANKSGEYFGYARMTSAISDDPSSIKSFIPSAVSTTVSESDLPKAILTPPTENAPRGRIIDDSARGTIFWEALSDEEVAEDTKEEQEGEPTDSDGVSNTWGKPFRVEWVSTTRVPFYRTRGLRNQWNSNREVKIARDGTELEENVGKRLLQMFHRSNTAPAQAIVPIAHSVAISSDIASPTSAPEELGTAVT